MIEIDLDVVLAMRKDVMLSLILFLFLPVIFLIVIYVLGIQP